MTHLPKMKPVAHVRAALVKYGVQVEACGSRVTCRPAPTDTDEDYVILVSEAKREELETNLLGDGWQKEGGTYEFGSAFTSFRKKHLNFIVTSETEFFDKYMVATRLCSRLNLLDKSDRIAVFRAVLYAEHTT